MAQIGDDSSLVINKDDTVNERTALPQTTGKATEKKETSADTRQESTMMPLNPGKNRRKIRQPKQYKPRLTVEASESIFEEKPEEVKAPRCETLSEERGLSEVEVAKEVARRKDSPGTTVHVMTASTSPKQKTTRVTTKSTGKKCTGKSSSKRAKPQSPPVPMKPEDLIKASLTDQQVAGGRRDAQYRKSYAYKIWKERSDGALSSKQDKTKKPEERKQQKVAPVYYTPPVKSTGFYANGKYYEMAPPQRIGSGNKNPMTTTTTAATYPIQVENATVVQHHTRVTKNIPKIVKVEEYPSPAPSHLSHSLEDASPSDKNPEKPNEVSSEIAAEKSSTEAHTGKQTTPVANGGSEMTALRIQQIKENIKPALVRTKRKFETEKSVSDFPTAKKPAKSTIFTPLNEQEAEKLANDIYDVNLEYFPIQTLAEKAAQAEGMENTSATAKTNKAEIEKVRCLLKDFYDVTRSCAEDPEMQKFDTASRKFGRKNILNHLSLLDRYFAELEKRMEENSRK